MSASQPTRPPFATLELDGQPPADALARALAAVQALVRAVSTAEPSRSSRGERVTCVPGPDGVALAIGGAQLALDLGLGRSPAELGERALGVVRAVAAADEAALDALLPDPAARRRAVAAVRGLAPRADEGWAARLAPADGSEPVPLAPGLAAEAAAPPRKGVRMTVVGELAAVDFGAERLTLRVGPAGRAVAGRYDAALEVKLLKLRRRAVHLTGEFALDEAGEPRAIRRVLDVAPVDLAPVTWTVLDTPAGPVAFDPPLTAEPSLDEATGQRYVWSDAVLELACAADSRDALIAAIEAEIGRRWAAVARPRGKGPEDVAARAWRRRLKPVATADAYA